MSQQEKKTAVTDGSEVPEETKKVAGEAQDPKNVGELTHYIQNMLQQMQDRSERNLPSFPPTSSNLLFAGSRRCRTKLFPVSTTCPRALMISSTTSTT